MFQFTIRENALLNEFLNLFTEYVNKSYKFTMNYVTNSTFTELREAERLILICINKSVFQNLYSFVKLNDSNMQYSAFACLENAVNSMRLYRVLSLYPDYMHDYITNTGFSLEFFENEISDKQDKYEKGVEEFSLKEFSLGLNKFNSFELRNAAISSQLCDGNVYLGLSCGKQLGEDLQNEVRKSLVGAYLALQIHNKMFFNGGIDSELEELEDNIYEKFLEYVKKF